MVQHPGKYRIIELQPTGSEKYAAAIAKGDSGLLKVVNSAIRDFNESAETSAMEGQIREDHGSCGREALEVCSKACIWRIQPKSLCGTARRSQRADTKEPIPKAPTGTALRRIQDRGHLVVAVREDLPGFGYRNPETGDLEGLEIDAGPCPGREDIRRLRRKFS